MRPRTGEYSKILEEEANHNSRYLLARKSDFLIRTDDFWNELCERKRWSQAIFGSSIRSALSASPPQLPRRQLSKVHLRCLPRVWSIFSPGGKGLLVGASGLCADPKNLIVNTVGEAEISEHGTTH
jgi:hypothetical protein